MKHYKIIAIALSKQQALDAHPKSTQQINFTGNLDGNMKRLIFFHYWRSKRNLFRFLTRNCWLSNSHLNKLKLGIKIGIEVTLKISSKVVGE